MTLLVFADTHGARRRMLDVAMREREAEGCLHLGDGVGDMEVLSTLFSPAAMWGVQGNCDYDRSDYENLLLPFGETTLFLTHGHHYGVKYGLDDLARTAAENGATAARFGHTHQPLFEQRVRLYLFNPGSLGQGRGALGPSYGLVTLEDGREPVFEIKPYFRE